MNPTSQSRGPRNYGPLLVGVLALQGIILLGQWTGYHAASSLPTASAQIPDSGALRMQTVDELKSINAKLDKLVDLFQSGNLQVKVASPDENKQTNRSAR